ncbi:MAG: hypothetical protein QM747_18330 [Nocardioides sp.]
MATSSQGGTRKLPKAPKRRPRTYYNDHPDTRPCPPWCWIVTDNPDGSYTHDISGTVEPRRMFEVEHTTHRRYPVVASLYTGHVARGGADLADTATIELNLRQVGQREPRIDVALRHNVWEQGKGWVPEYDYQRLKLSIEDARELSAMLAHVVALSELEPES